MITYTLKVLCNFVKPRQTLNCMYVNIIVNKWIDCNDTAGIFDNETGKWTGAVGQVYDFSE